MKNTDFCSPCVREARGRGATRGQQPVDLPGGGLHSGGRAGAQQPGLLPGSEVEEEAESDR